MASRRARPGPAGAAMATWGRPGTARIVWASAAPRGLDAAGLMLRKHNQPTRLREGEPRMNRRTPLAACLAAASLALLLHPAAATAALFAPTQTSDGADGACDERDCSLREAVIAANALPGEDVVLLAPGV